MGIEVVFPVKILVSCRIELRFGAYYVYPQDMVSAKICKDGINLYPLYEPYEGRELLKNAIEGRDYELLSKELTSLTRDRVKGWIT